MKNRTIPIDEDFFCDGHYYLLTSSSLGGSGLAAAEISDIVGSDDSEGMRKLLDAGIAVPLCFDGDCALDNNTLFVVGDLTEEQERNWIAKIECKLNIPCGKFVLLCGGACPEELEDAISLKPPDPDYRISQVIDVPQGEHLVEILAYYPSMTVQQSLAGTDRKAKRKEGVALKEWYEKNRPGVEGIGYVIRFSPLRKKVSLPKLDEETGWVGVFEFRE